VCVCVCARARIVCVCCGTLEWSTRPADRTLAGTTPLLVQGGGREAEE